MPTSSYILRTVLEPIPGSFVTSTSVAGYFSFSFTAAGISPSSISATTFVCSVSPMPSMSVAVPAWAISPTECGYSRMIFAASL